MLRRTKILLASFKQLSHRSVVLGEFLRLEAKNDLPGELFHVSTDGRRSRV